MTAFEGELRAIEVSDRTAMMASLVSDLVRLGVDPVLPVIVHTAQTGLGWVVRGSGLARALPPDFTGGMI